MAEQKAGGDGHAIGRILLEIILPAIGFGLSMGFATRDYPVSLATGLAISVTILVFYRLDQVLLRPRLEGVPRDWLKIGLEMTLSLLEHLLGASLALFLASRLFGFRIVPSAAWLALLGMVIVFPIIHGTETALRYYRRLQDKERAEERLRSLATQAELRALKAQIDPHFLFNTLNTVAQLIHTDPTQAEATIERLADMFRYVLTGSQRGVVSLREELAFLDDYLEIERARFGPRLRVDRRIAEGILDVPVPSLILQPLVENAVRYGQGEDGQVALTIRAEPHGSQLTIHVADRGPGMPPNHTIGEGTGFGLYNVDQRLCKTYGEDYGLEIRGNEPHGTLVTVRIPLRGNEHAHTNADR